MRIADNI